MPRGIYPHKKGIRPSGETRKKMSAIHKGKIISEKQRKDQSDLMKSRGVKPPSFLGKKHSVETIEKLRMANIGKSRLTDEYRKKMSENQIGKKNINYGKKLSEEHRRKIGRRGCEHHNWLGGKTPLNRAARNSFEYKEWRKKVFDRDKYTCVLCYKTGGELNADHIKQFAYYPELRFDINNGRTLCVECHKKTDTFKKKIYDR